MYKLQLWELSLVSNCFEDNKTILTQADIREMTELTQPAVVLALNYLENEGTICWERMEGVKQVKFYNLLRNWY